MNPERELTSQAERQLRELLAPLPLVLEHAVADFVKQLAAHKPLRAVFRDAGFAGDSLKVNVEQLFKLLSPATEIKTL